MEKKTIEEEEKKLEGLGRAPGCWPWAPEDIYFRAANIRPSHRRELTVDGTLIKGTAHTLEKCTESREREVSPGAESTDAKEGEGPKLMLQ